MAEFLRACVQQRLNIVISGGTGTGKTTLLNALSEFIPNRERIVTIEDPIEMQLQQPHVISMEARPPNIEGERGHAARPRAERAAHAPGPHHRRRGPRRRSLRHAAGDEHRPRRLAHHRARERPADALARIENMVLMAGFDLPVRAIREQVASALHLVVPARALLRRQAPRQSCVSEITGLESGIITMQELYRFEQTGVAKDGEIRRRADADRHHADVRRAVQEGRHQLEMGIAGMRWR